MDDFLPQQHHSTAIIEDLTRNGPGKFPGDDDPFITAGIYSQPIKVDGREYPVSFTVYVHDGTSQIYWGKDNPDCMHPQEFNAGSANHAKVIEMLAQILGVQHKINLKKPSEIVFQNIDLVTRIEKAVKSAAEKSN